MAQDPANLIWIDLEMTGLRPDQDHIIEIATAVTDAELNLVAEGPVLVVHQSSQVLDRMDEWNTRQHGESGLSARVLASACDEAMAEERTLEFLRRHVPPRVSPMCGNSICQDRRFLYRWMPQLEAYFHYRNLDVSSLKELCRRWVPALADGFCKQGRHRAMQDIHDSIAELRYYREHFLRVP